MLAAYAERLSTVEIDATFYRPPDPDTLAGWYRTVPPGYLFALKAPREVTHERRLAGIADAVRTFYLGGRARGEARGGPLPAAPDAREGPVAHPGPPRARPTAARSRAGWSVSARSRGVRRYKSTGQAKGAVLAEAMARMV
jgi:hypothetical protein